MIGRALGMLGRSYTLLGPAVDTPLSDCFLLIKCIYIQLIHISVCAVCVVSRCQTLFVQALID